MQELRTNLEIIINSSIDEIKQKMLSICEEDSKTELNVDSATIFIEKMKVLVNELGSQVAKGYFESRDEQKEYIEVEEKRFLLKGKSPKKIATCLGNITLSRNYYQHRSGGKSAIPLDISLGIENDMMMPDVKEVVLYSSAHNTPEETSRLLAKCSLINVHATQIKRAILSTNDLMESSENTVMENVREKESVPESDIIACSLDGVNVLLNKKGSKKGRPLERPVKEQKQAVSAYKNAMCGSVTHYQLSPDNTEQAKRISTKYIARMPEDSYPTFKAEFEKELKKVKAMPSVKLVITDAHKSIMGYLNDNPVFSDYYRIIDFFHASEHLSHLSEAIHGKSLEKGKLWYNKYRDIIKYDEDGILKLIRSAEYYINSLSISKSRRKEAIKHIRYFKNHKEYMNYAYYLEQGWPIGSGIIEAACKSVVKQRMCRSGQRWSIQGGQAILNLRSIVKSDRWENFWGEFSNEYYMGNAA